MTNWNQLLLLLDKTLGFPNKLNSRVRKVRQGFDERKNEHVFLIEYRVRVQRGSAAPKTGNASKPARKPEPELPALRELLAAYKESAVPLDA